MIKKTLLAIIVILLFVATITLAQEKNNDELKITFKPYSIKLSNENKRKIIAYIKNHPLDSDHMYAAGIAQDYNARKETNWERFKTLEIFMQKNNIPKGMVYPCYGIRDPESIILYVISIEEAPSSTPPNFPNLRK